MKKKASTSHAGNKNRFSYRNIDWQRCSALVLQFLLLAASAVGLVLGLTSLYALSVPMDALWTFLCAMVPLSFLMAASRRRLMWILLGILFAGWYVWGHADLLVQGWLLLLERALLPMDLVLPNAALRLLQPADAVAADAGVLLALKSLFAVLLPLVGACIAAGTSVIGLLCSIVVPLLPGLVAGLVPPLFPTMLLLTVCLVLTAYGRAYRAETETLSEFEETELSEPQHGHGAWTAAALGMIPIVLLTLFVSTRLLPEQGYERPMYARQLREKVLELELETLFEAYNDGLSRGDLTRLSDIRFTGEAALAVRVSEELQLYLSGYTGAVFTGTRWEMPLQSAYNRDAVGFSDPMPQNLHAALSDAETYEISVKNLDAAADAMFLPNGLSTLVSMMDTTELLQDGALPRAQTAAFAYSAAAVPFSALPSGIPAQEDLAASYRAAALHAARNAEISVQRSAENYVQYVMETYTQLPEETQLAAEQLCEQYGLHLAAENGVYDVAALCRSVREVLRSECRYVYEPQAVPNGVDFATWFLRESREGYCVHFATTAAVLLRSMGIPTRYAEGYIVIRSDYDKPRDADGYVQIEDTHAHAWAEVFDPVQLVWIPVEMTPSASDAPLPTQTPQPMPTESPSEDEPTMEPELPEPTPEPLTEAEADALDDPQEDPEMEQASNAVLSPENMPLEPLPNGGVAAPPVSQQSSSVRWIGLVVLVLLLLSGGVLLVRTVVKNRYERRLNGADVTAAVLEACRLAQKLLFFADCPARAVGQSAEQYAAAAAKTQSAFDEEKLARLFALAERAAFSEQRCTDRDRAEAIALLENQKRAYAASLPLWKRTILWLRQP